MNKADLRRQLRALRRALPPAQRAAETAAAVRICQGLCVGLIASYAATADELDLAALHAAYWQRGLPVLLPRVAAPGVLDWHLVSSPGQLIVGSYGIREPDPRLAAATTLPPSCRVFVPGLGFTADGGRLGQGGGFYDHLLALRPDVRAIGVGFACQLIEAVPSEPHDARLAGLVIADRLLFQP